ncbi:hypothetical protein V2V72_07745 [Streptococcus agalactiae]
MKKYFWLIINSLLAGVVIGLLIINTTLTAVFVEEIKLNKELKSELKVKDKQIDGLHEQLRRTQYQLKKASEQNVEQTKRIADLTGNGG